MVKLLLLTFLVTVYPCYCYGHYPNRRTLPTQSDSEFDLAQLVKSISNDFDWNFGGQIQTSQYNSEPDVVVMVIEYQSNQQIRKPSPHHQYRPHDGQPQPSQPSFSIDTSHGDNHNNKFWYHKMYQNQYGYDRPRLPDQPLVEQTSGGYKYENPYKKPNFGNNHGYENFNTQTNERPWVQNQGNYNNQNYDGHTQYNEHYRPTQIDQRPTSYDPPVFGYPNQYNQNNQWYADNMNQWVEPDQQPPNNEGIISGIQNPINNNPSNVISQFPTNPNVPIEDKVAEKPESTSVVPLDPTGTGMESENKKPEEEEEEFKIDVRFNTE